MSLWRFLANIPAQKRARAAAAEACRIARPTEAILGSVVCADEEERHVVRVFIGRRERGKDSFEPRLPPWRQCLIFAVPKRGGAAVELDDAGRYLPVVR